MQITKKYMKQQQLQQKIKETVSVLSEKRSAIIKNFRKKLEERVTSDLRNNINNSHNQ